MLDSTSQTYDICIGYQMGFTCKRVGQAVLQIGLLAYLEQGIDVLDAGAHIAEAVVECAAVAPLLAV